ncbi:Pol [Symbiodinium sp. CCMP2592]|nr:Pol [Symbiodinium sp. CCMP2592]
MQMQIWQGLSTHPLCNNGSHLLQRDDDAMLMGCASSSRSQFREGADDEAKQSSAALPPGVRVDGTSFRPSGAGVETPVKRRDSKVGLIPTASIEMSRVKKRSLRRAVRRAQRTPGGGATYRGHKLIHRQAFSPASAAPVAAVAQTIQRIDILSWNCSGLTQLLFEELKLYLRKHSEIMVVCIQETHRAFQNEWVAEGWTFIHSASPKAHQGGVLLGFRNGSCDRDSLRWQELSPGRLLHARCFAKNQHMDFICIYQHALPFEAEALQATLDKRRKLWTQLDALLKAMPVRSSIVIAGDLNSNLCTSPPCIGPSVLHNQAKPKVLQERQWLTGMLAAHQLVALNTWSRKQPTHRHPSGTSQIDFVLVRTSLADQEARRCQPTDPPMAGWRSSGHQMLRASIPLRWQPWRLNQCRRQGNCKYQEGVGSDISQLRGYVGQFEQQPSQGVQKPGIERMDGEIMSFWEARKLLARREVFTLRGMFARVRILLALRRRHKELQAVARARKRQQLLATLDLAEQAASKGSSRDLYQCVRWLAPRNLRRSIRLRSSEGGLMHPREECKLLAEYATTLFKAKRDCDKLQVALQALDPQMFSPAAWIRALKSLKTGKAVPAQEPSIKCWQDCRAEVAVQLSHIATKALCGDHPSVPADWTDMQMAWLAKAGKSPSTPENLRTIGLMPADTKAFLIVLRNEAAPYITAALKPFPQYAYRPGASTADALLRASAHCHEVRELLHRHRGDHTSRVLGTDEVPLVGGLMCGLDLQKAFDALPHTEIHRALLDSGVPGALAGVIAQVHVQTRCKVRHGGEERMLVMTRGLRQGCPIAPIVYAAWTCRLGRLMDQALGDGWSRKHGTLFADDIFTHWVLRSPDDLKHAIQALWTLIDILQRLGMAISFQKTVAVLKLRGRLASKLSKSLLVWKQGAQYLRIRCDHQDVHIPLQTTIEYLGATLSYGNFEQQTLQTRAAQTTRRFQELRRVLRTNGALTLRHRLRLYKAVIWPILTYALTSVGVTNEVLKGVCSLMSGHLRKVLRIYEEGISNQAVMTRAGIAPLLFFRGQVASRCDSISKDAGRDEALKALEKHRSIAILQHLQELEITPASTTLCRVARSEIVPVDCPVCGIAFPSQASLQMHIQHQHVSVNRQARLEFRRDQHALHGLPICRFCQTRLHDWRSLEKHITEGTCPRVKTFVAQSLSEERMLQLIAEEEERSPPVPPAGAPSDAQVVDEVDTALQMTVTELRTHGSRLRVLASRCALCRQLIPDGSKIKIHWQRTHATEWQAVSQKAIAESRSLSATFTTPCSYCGSTARNSLDHSSKCSALFQFLSVLQLRRQGHTEVRPSRGASLKQSQCTPEYQKFDVVCTPIGKFFAVKAAGAEAMSKAGTGRPLTLSSQLVIRSLVRDWTFDRRQHDAAEFTHKLLRGLGLGAHVWDARFEDLEGVHTPLSGGSPITMCIPHEDCDLQTVVNQWSQQGFAHALIRHDIGVALQLARNSEAVKNEARISIGALIMMPCFARRAEIVWRAFQVRSIVEHHGPAVTEGHYRHSASVWMWGDSVDSHMEGSEEWSFFSQYMPAGVKLSSPPSDVSTAADEREPKSARLGLAKGGTQQGKGANGGNQHREKSRVHSRADEDENSEVHKEVKAIREALEMVQKLVLRHEDAVNLLRPMRTSLLVCFLAELKSRLVALEQNEDDLNRLAELGWLVLEHLAILLKHVVNSNSLTRFHPTRPLSEEMRGDTLVFLVQVGLQGESAEFMRSSLKALCYSASLQLVATQLGEDRQSRSNLANMVAAALPGGN